MLYCPSTHGSSNRWVGAFTSDNDEAFWGSGIPGRADGDGIGELPGNPDVSVSSYVVRYSTDNKWGSMKAYGTAPGNDWSATWKALAYDLVTVMPREQVSNHGHLYNILLLDGSVLTRDDSQGWVRGLVEGKSGEDLDTILDKEICVPLGFESEILWD